MSSPLMKRIYSHIHQYICDTVNKLSNSTIINGVNFYIYDPQY